MKYRYERSEPNVDWEDTEWGRRGIEYILAPYSPSLGRMLVDQMENGKVVNIGFGIRFRAVPVGAGK